MFFGVVFLVLAIVAVPLLGGKLGALGDLKFARPEFGIAALLTQGLVLGLLPDGDRTLHAIVHLGSYGLMAIFVAANLSIPGLGTVALGGALNAVAIAANGGVMPADPHAFASAGLHVTPGEFVNSAPNAHATLGFLGDVFWTPANWPLANVFSVGDCLIVLGVAWLVLRVCRTWPARVVDNLLDWAAPRVPRFALLRDNNAFRRLWVAQVVSNLGDWIYPLAVFTAAVGSNAGAEDLAFLLIAQSFPAILVGFFGGPLIDRFPRRPVLLAADVVRFAAVGSLLLVDGTALTHLYGVAFVLGLCSGLYQPAYQASLPNLVKRDQLASANALVGATFSFAVMAGPPLGSLLVAQGGIKFAFAANALSFGASAVLVAGTRWSGTRRPAGSQQESLAQELRAGWSYVRSNPIVRQVLAVVCLVTLAAGLKQPFEPLLALKVLHAGPTGLGLMGGFWGVGMALGAIAAAPMLRRYGHGRLLANSVAVVGLVIILAAASPVLWPLLGLWLFGGAANTMGTVAYETLLLETTPDHLRGRVMAAVEASMEAGLMTGVVTAGVVSTFGSTRFGYFLSGLAFLAAAGVAFRGLRRARVAASTHVTDLLIPAPSMVAPAAAPAMVAAGPRPHLASVRLLPAGSTALLRVHLDGANGTAPILIVDDGSIVHRLDALPGSSGDGRYGYGVPTALLERRRSALALEFQGELYDVPRSALVGA